LRRPVLVRGAFFDSATKEDPMHTRWLSIAAVGLLSLTGCAKGPSTATAPSTSVAVPVDGGKAPALAPAALPQANQAPQSALKLVQ
jgi:hypothetical protein